MTTRCGGTSEPRPATEADIALLAPLRASVEARLGRSVDQFEPVLVATQVVAGTNYFAKVRTGPEDFVHLRVFQPLLHTKEVARLCGVQTGKIAGDPVVYFAAD